MDPLNVQTTWQPLYAKNSERITGKFVDTPLLQGEMLEKGIAPPGAGLIPKTMTTGIKDSSSVNIFGAASQVNKATIATTLTGAMGRAVATSLKMIFDLKGSGNFKNFRTMQDEVTPPNGKSMPSTEGLATLKASGSSEFSRAGLETIKGKIGNDNMVVVDLREESHGYFDGKPVSWRDGRNWANQGMTVEQVEQTEIGLLKQAQQNDSSIKTISTEEQICKSAAVGYERVPVSDQARPEDRDVDQFVAFKKSLPPDTWLHFHCKAGEGRTTTFLALMDMMQNAKTVSFEDILHRQNYIGGLDLFMQRPTSGWEGQEDAKRLSFLKDFYHYCSSSNDDFNTTWSQWAAAQGQGK
jgi:hypothetical protein